MRTRPRARQHRDRPRRNIVQHVYWVPIEYSRPQDYWMNGKRRGIQSDELYFVRFNSDGHKALERLQQKHPDSVYIVPDNIRTGWQAFIPLWCRNRPRRFFERLSRANWRISYYVCSASLGQLQEMEV